MYDAPRTVIIPAVAAPAAIGGGAAVGPAKVVEAVLPRTGGDLAELVIIAVALIALGLLMIRFFPTRGNN